MSDPGLRGSPILRAGFEEARFLDPDSGLPWIVPGLFMPRDLTALGSQSRAPLVHLLATYWAIDIAKDRSVLMITRHSQRFMSYAHDFARAQELSTEDMLSSRQLYVKPTSANGGEDWNAVSEIAIDTRARLVLVVREQGLHSDEDIAGYRMLTENGSAVLVAMGQVDSVVADAADVLLTVEHRFDREFSIMVHKGSHPRRDAIFHLEDGIPVRKR